MVDIFMKYVSTIGAACIYYDKNLRIFYITTTARKRHYFSFGILVISGVLCIIRTLQVYLKEGRLKDLAVCYIFTVLISFFTGLSGIVICEDIRDLLFLMAQTLKFGREFQSQFF